MTRARTATAVLAAALSWLCPSLLLVPRAAGAQTITVGVVDFYAPTPLTVFTGFFPERFAADELARLLAQSARGQLAIVPRAAMQQAEGGLGWQDADVLRFDRLRALARAVGADRLVVGRIPLLTVEGGGHGIFVRREGDGGPPTAVANIVVQVFDEAQGRLIAETRQGADALGGTRSLVAAQALDIALERALPQVMRSLTGQAP